MDTKQDGNGVGPGGRKVGFQPGNRVGAGPKPNRRSPPPRLLSDMRAVYEDPEGKDGTPSQKMLRKLLADNPKEFMTQLAGLEKAHAAGAAKSGKKDAPAVPSEPEGQEAVQEPDEGAARVEELI